MVAAKKKTFEVAIKMGVPPRAEIGSADETKEYLDMGVRHFSVGTDITILHGFWQREGEGIRKALGGSGPERPASRRFPGKRLRR